MGGLSFTDNLIGGISDKSQGNMRIFLQKDNPITAHNRELFFAPFKKKVVAADLVHGVRVAVVDYDSAGVVTSCDALITNCPGLILSVTVADCLPIYFYDQVKKVVGLAHAGWRGVEGNIASETVKALVDNYDSLQTDLKVFIGPHIGFCHFEVQVEVAEKFSAWPEFIISRGEKTYIDLAGIVKAQLIASGLVAENISVSPECTYCLPHKYFSFRRDQPSLANLETMVAVIGLK